MMPSTKSKVELGAAEFVHLHNHTQYSLLDGLTKVPALVSYVKEAGMQAVAMTDHGTLSGTIELYKEATAQGIKPIIGMETYVASRTIHDRDVSKDKLYYHLILLAINHQGYQNLMRLSTIANLQGVYYKPRIDHTLLEEYNEGLIVLSGCIGGELGENIRQGQIDKAREIASWYKSLLGDRYYIELADHGHPGHPSFWKSQGEVNEALIKIAAELDLPCVVTCDAHYLRHEDQLAHEILLCVQTGSFLSDEKRMSLQELELHVTHPLEVIKRWGKDHPEFISNTRVIADRCNVTIELGKILIPKFPVPEGEDEKSYLEKLVWRGLAWRYGKVAIEQSEKLSIAAARKKLSKEIIERSEYELSVMDSMGYNGYFLIVQDFIGWGKDRGIVFGPGRGSAAGSIVAYAIRITEIEPLKYNLMFERFLNPGRISMPDIDIDIQDTRRDEVIQYCIEKYGKDRVANIVTFGRMAARNAVRDVSRVLQVPYAEADRLAKMIPMPVQGRHIPLAKSLKTELDLKHEYETNETAKRVFDLAIQLEGTIRSHGVHAAGVVIAPDDIVKFVPLELAQKGVIATQYPMGPVEELGLLKMDFLGLSNLTILNNALRIIRKVYKKTTDLSEIPNDDPKTFELLQQADTTGVFQLESAGMKRYLRELKPTLFEDIIAMGALYRPGPMSEIPRFIEGKNNPSSITYLHESLEPILQDTYGVMVYQEQVIKLLQFVAGYSPGEADLVRKAIGKKKRDIMTAEQPKFIKGCIKRGLTQNDAERLWAQIQPFADYSFNKAHATCYAQISYWTAYLKAHYPSAFMAALMTSDYNDADRLAIEITECQHMGIQVLPPDVNESFVEFAVVPSGDNRRAPIRFGMNAIKNVGTGAVEEILRAREIDGPFTSLEDFLGKVNVRLANRKVLESLVRAGALDRFGDRSQLLHNIDAMLAYANRLQRDSASGQTDLFGNSEVSTVDLRPQLILESAGTIYSARDQLLWERELLGLYLTQHPLAMYETFLSEQTSPLSGLQPEHDGKAVTVGGAVVEIREVVTKNNQKMAFVKIEDRSGEGELILFPSAYQQTTGLWERDRVVVARGKVNAKDRDGNQTNEVKIMVDDAREITAEQASGYQPTGKKPKVPAAKKNTIASKAEPTKKQPIKRVYIRLADSSNQQLLVSLKRAIDSATGSTDVVLVLGPTTDKQVIKLPAGITPEQPVMDQLRELVGIENVKIQ
ncbi:MAG TPA: DNA polymerase III subunit alpha [Candidatus Saccharimonadales bacterium]|nr:DNA polymerase III subunit alpha [Candidatus Saccharimonadales bacterium]